MKNIIAYKIASHGNEGPKDATSPQEGVSTDTSLKPAEKEICDE